MEPKATGNKYGWNAWKTRSDRLAPATWGSPQAHKGRTWLGALVKGNKDFLGPDFLNAGDRVLEGLELGSSFTWRLAHLDLLGPEPFYDKGDKTPFVAVFIGNQAYQGLGEASRTDPGNGRHGAVVGLQFEHAQDPNRF